MTSTVARSLSQSSKTSEMAPARLTTVAHKEGERENLYATEELQGLAKRWAPGCVNTAGKDRQKW